MLPGDLWWVAVQAAIQKMWGHWLRAGLTAATGALALLLRLVSGGDAAMLEFIAFAFVPPLLVFAGVVLYELGKAGAKAPDVAPAAPSAEAIEAARLLTRRQTGVLKRRAAQGLQLAAADNSFEALESGAKVWDLATRNDMRHAGLSRADMHAFEAAGFIAAERDDDIHGGPKLRAELRKKCAVLNEIAARLLRD